MAIDQTLLLDAIEHYRRLLYERILGIGDQHEVDRTDKTTASGLFDRIAEILIARTNLIRTGNPIDSGDTSTIQTTAKSYLVDALEAYKGTIEAKAISTELDVV